MLNACVVAKSGHFCYSHNCNIVLLYYFSYGVICCVIAKGGVIARKNR